jgi:hypothetical protein
VVEALPRTSMRQGLKDSARILIEVKWSQPDQLAVFRLGDRGVGAGAGTANRARPRSVVRLRLS